MVPMILLDPTVKSGYETVLYMACIALFYTWNTHAFAPCAHAVYNYCIDTVYTILAHHVYTIVIHQCIFYVFLAYNMCITAYTTCITDVY